jgi:spore coat polysaccharide biosynthesis predicted glycosyltransferase SpsG
MKRRLIFRTDANTKIGRGHLSRCLAIADMLKETMDVLFLYNMENKSYIENLSIPYRFEAILSEANFFDFVNQEDVVWLDGYTFDESFKKRLRSLVFKLIETNDLPYKVENVDLLFNHTPGLKEEQFDVVDSRTKLYIGLNYALLRSAFLEKAKNFQESPRGSGIFVCFGGVDTFNLGSRFVQGLVESNFKDPIYWVSNKSKEELPELSENVHVMCYLSQHEMIEYMSKSKILLIPSSMLSFEAIALRRPFYTGYFVDNQELIAQGLKAEGLAIGCRNLEINEEFEKAFDELLIFYLDELKQKELVTKQQKYIDGKSQSRIQKILKNL